VITTRGPVLCWWVGGDGDGVGGGGVRMQWCWVRATYRRRVV